MSKLYSVNIKDKFVVELTAKELESLHARLTNIYNENYEEITNESYD